MCGIAGKVCDGGNVDRAMVEAMCERQAHRGPDSRGLHCADGVALGIQRLRVIDLETGDQPIYNEDRSIAVVLNGEIYNYRELRESLEARGHRFATKSDTEVIPHLYEELGSELVNQLHGMFAFALWDESKGALLIGRDRVGKKPLFYAQGPGWLSFASELAALAVDSGVDRELDPSSIDCYLGYGYIPAPWTIWKGVRKLPPAHTLLWERGQVSTRRYWTLDYSNPQTREPAELESELRAEVSAAVRRRMIADVPLGAFLSGGIDSSIVVSEMARASSQPVKTFSIGFGEPRYDELARARLVAERYSTDHHELTVKPDARAIIPTLVRHYGEPYADSSAIPTFYIAEMARREVTVALNGDGGDESFAGYMRHVVNALTSGLDAAPAGLRRTLARAGGLVPAGADAKSRIAYLHRFLTSLGGDAAGRYTEHVSVFAPAERRALIRDPFRAQIDESRAREVIRGPWQSSSAVEALGRLLDVDVQTYLPGDLLVKVDIASMAHSLEARSPLLDHKLMEFAASVPATEKAKGLTTKRLLRSAYRDELPTEITSGAKMGFAVPLGSWFREDLRSFVREILLDPRALIHRYLDAGEIARLLDLHDSRAADVSQKLWALLMLELWHHELGS